MNQSNVVSITGANQAGTPTAQRALALFGPTPLMTFQPDAGDPDLCCSVRLLPTESGAWVGLVADSATFTDRVRMGLKPRFVVHHSVDVPTVCGEAEVTVVGRTDAALPSGYQRAAQKLLSERVFARDDLVLIAVSPCDVRVDEGEGPEHGAIPRT